MRHPVAVKSRTVLLRDHLWPAQRAAVPMSTWSFVYVFFTNGTPFDSPNRSETCRVA